MKTPYDCNKGSDQLIDPVKPLCGLSESGDYLDRIMCKHLEEDLGMNTCVSDSASLYKQDVNELIVMCNNYVDDSSNGGSSVYSNWVKRTEKKFLCRLRDWDIMQFSGVQIETDGKEFYIHQKRYISRLKLLPPYADYAQFRSLRAKPSSTTQSRPDISCAVFLLAQVTEESFHKEDFSFVKETNKIV